MEIVPVMVFEDRESGNLPPWWMSFGKSAVSSIDPSVEGLEELAVIFDGRFKGDF